MFKNKNVKRLGAAFLASTALVACERTRTTEVAVELRGYGREVNIDSEPGMKCFFPCWFGHEYIHFTKGEIEIQLLAIDPTADDARTTVDGTTASALIQTQEQLPMSGVISLFIRLDINDENESQLEALYRQIPKEQGENEEQYRSRVFGRLATIALQPVQTYYQGVSVQDALQNREERAATIVANVQEAFDNSDLSFIKVERANIATLNRGNEAENSARRFALVEINRNIAEQQQAVAETVAQSRATYASITADTIRQFREAGAGDDPEGLATMLCFHLEATDPNFDEDCQEGFPTARISSGGPSAPRQ